MSEFNNARTTGSATKGIIYKMKATNSVLSINIKHLEKTQYELDHNGSSFSNLS